MALVVDRGPGGAAARCGCWARRTRCLRRSKKCAAGGVCRASRQYLRSDCYIEGEVDFHLREREGGGLQDCEVQEHRASGAGGFPDGARAREGRLRRTRVTCSTGAEADGGGGRDEGVYLGRPWRDLCDGDVPARRRWGRISRRRAGGSGITGETESADDGGVRRRVRFEQGRERREYGWSCGSRFPEAAEQRRRLRGIDGAGFTLGLGTDGMEWDSGCRGRMVAAGGQ